MEALAKAMGGEGKYIVYVGSLTVPLHNKWADAAIALQKAKYPKMELVADRFGVAESMDDSYKTALDQMRAHPDLKGILAFGSQGPIGAARAVEERGKAKTVAVVGPFSPGPGGQVHQVRRHPRGLHLEPDARRRDDRPDRRHAGQGRGAEGRHGACPGSGKVKVDTRDAPILAAEAPAHQQGHDRRAGPAWASRRPPGGRAAPSAPRPFSRRRESDGSPCPLPPPRRRHQALRRRAWRSTASTGTSSPARCTASSARTAAASPR